MANEPKQKSFKVTVRGTYKALSATTGSAVVKPYEEVFILPSQEAALSIICKHLLSPRLKKSHSDYVRYRTHTVVDITLLNYKPNKEVLQMSVEEMNLLDLHDFCILRKLMIDPYKHGDKDIYAIREMVLKANTDKRADEKERLTSKAGQALKAADELRALNDLPPTEEDIGVNINEQKLLANQRALENAAVMASSRVNESPAVESDEPLPPFEPEPEIQ